MQTLSGSASASNQSTTGDRLSLKPYRAHIAIGEDRIVEMSEEDATCLIPVGWTLLTEPPCDCSG